MRKNVLDFNNLTSVVGIVGTSKSLIGSAVDGVTSLMGKSVCIQLISATKADGQLSLSHALIVHYSNGYYIYSQGKLFTQVILFFF